MSVREKIASGAAWMSIMMVVDRLIGFVSVIVLARLLTPADYGIVAMCMSVIAGLQIFTAFGFDVVLIQNQKASRDSYDTVFTLNVMFGVAVAAAIVGLAELTAIYYNEPEVSAPMMVLAIGFFVRSLENIKVVDFRKDLEFHKEAILRVSQKIAGFVVTILAAVYLENYWALVIGMVWMHVFSVALSYAMKPYRPQLTLSKMREIFSFSGWLFLNNSLIFVEMKFADFLVGAKLGARSLGLLNMAMELGATPATQLIAAVNRAVYPGYAKLADDGEELAKTYLFILCAISVVAMPIGLGIASISEVLVPVVLGNKWVDAAPLLAILGLHSVTVVLTGNTSYVFYALGIPRQMTYFSAMHVVMLVVTTILFVSALGIVGAAWALLFTNVVFFPVIVFMVKKHLPVSVSGVSSSLWRSTLAGAVMYACVTYLLRLQLDVPNLVELVIAIGVGAVSYVCALVVLVLCTGFRQLREWSIAVHAYGMVAPRIGLPALT